MFRIKIEKHIKREYKTGAQRTFSKTVQYEDIALEFKKVVVIIKLKFKYIRLFSLLIFYHIHFYRSIDR